ncbi:MAG TPA: Hsp20/alpha crystallin family protein [bacterium]|nr:Hsp20/alpha crystallin family protein [bacterium]
MVTRWNRWDPFEEIGKFQREVGNLFGRSLGLLEPGATTQMTNWFPPMEAFYHKNALMLRAFIPGVVPKEVDISVTGNLLTIKGERKVPAIPPEGYLFSEITYAKFERTLTLPEGLKTDKIHATCLNGVLEITIPVTEAVLPKKVTVEEVVPHGEKVLAGAVR